MTFLYIFLCILGSLLLIIAAVLFLPVCVSVKFKEDFFIKIKFSGIKVFSWSSEEEPKTEEKKESKGKKPAEKKEKREPEKNAVKALFEKLKEKHGFVGAVKVVFGFALDSLSHIKRLLRHIKIKAIRLNLVYGGQDAAETAVEYGKICSAVYPVTALLDSCRNIDFKNITVQSDFEKKRTDFDFSLKVNMQIFFLLIAAFKIYGEYKNFLLRNDLE